MFAATEEAELYEEGYAGHDAAGVLDELAHGAGGAAGGEQVIYYEDAGALGDGVEVDLEGVLAVLELVGGGDGLSGELVGFAGEDEPLLGAVGQGRPEDEAPGLGGEDARVVYVLGGTGHSVDSGVEGGAILYEGGYVLERDAWLGEVGYFPDMALYLLDDYGLPRDTVCHEEKPSMTFAIISSLSLESTAARWRALFTAS